MNCDFVKEKVIHVKKAAFRAAFLATIPVLTGFAFLGMAYGVLMNTKGYGAFYTLLMSAVAFCGSMQFAAIPFLTGIFHPLQVFLLSLMVNARHLFYGISMLEKYKGIGKIKPFLIYTLCDETFSIVGSTIPPKGIDRTWYYFFVSFLDYLYWVAGSFLGGLLGSVVKFDTKGLDFVLTALFVVMFIEQWEQKKREKKSRFSAVTGVMCSIFCLIVFGVDQFIIPAMALILLALTVFRKCET